MSTSIPAPRKAEKKRVKLKMAVQGPSGSGKTWGALALAKNLWLDAKVCVVDTENESASLYADTFEFDTIPLGPPFTTARYVECIDAVVKGGYDVLILDSITPQWDGEGGVLRRKEALERQNPNANGFALWSRFTPEHEMFKQCILQAPVHVIATMRSKQEYALQTNEKGRQVPVKLGLAPIQRDQMDYEFTLVFDVNLLHSASVSKDRTGLFNEQTVDLADPKTAEAIRGWLDKGVDAPATAYVSPVTPAGVEGAISHEPVGAPATTGNVKEAAQTRAAAQEAELNASIHPPELVSPGMLQCRVLGITERATKPGQDRAKSPGGRPFLEVFWEGRHEGFSFARCFHASLFDCLKTATTKPCLFSISSDSKGIKIEDVAVIDGTGYVNGKSQPPAEENQPIDIGF